jgi:hypothetical protein
MPTARFGALRTRLSEGETQPVARQGGVRDDSARAPVGRVTRARSHGARGVASLLLAACTWTAVGGCGSGGTAAPARPPGVNRAAANSITAGTPRAALLERLGQPVLTSRPTRLAPNGCLYYAMRNRPLSDVWEFCLDGRGRVNKGATLYSPSQPAPPPGASAARAVLLARGDAICESDNARLARPTKRLARLIKRLDPQSQAGDRLRASRLIGEFSAAINRVRAQLAEFNAPGDERSELSAYLSALQAQAAALDRAAVLLAGRDARYLDLREKVNSLSETATAHARQYGFRTCSALAFS